MLSAGAFNALLKTLEEPPEHVKFIFATTEGQKVPATITSRCQRFDLRRIPARAIAEHLLAIAEKENILLEPEAAEDIARGAEGALRDAESMLDQCRRILRARRSARRMSGGSLDLPRAKPLATLAVRILQRDATGSLKIVAEQARSREGYVAAAGRSHRARARSAGRRRGRSAVRAARGKLLMLLDHFAETESRMRWAADKKLQLDVAVIKATHLLDQASLDEVIETLIALRGGAPLPPRSAQPPQSKPAIRSGGRRARPPSAESLRRPLPSTPPSLGIAWLLRTNHPSNFAG